MISAQVAEALMPILCSMAVQVTPLRAPTAPSSVSRNFGTTKSEMPFTPAGASGQPGEHQMNDVLGQVMFAGRNEDLLPLSV